MNPYRIRSSYVVFFSFSILLVKASPSPMASSGEPSSDGDELIHDAESFIRIYKSGRVERLVPFNFAPPSVDPETGVSSKDIVITAETGVKARIYLPAAVTGTTKKVPVLVYYHGGGFCLGSAFDAAVHDHLNALAAEATAIVVSVEYRLAPEHPVPVPYDDSWAALRWVAAHSAQGPERWLSEHGNFNRLYVGGESAGANIAHHMAMRCGSEGEEEVKLHGLVLVHPYFLGAGSVESEEIDRGMAEMLVETWNVVSPTTPGVDRDPWINPVAPGAPSVAMLGCKRALVCVGGADVMRDRAKEYYSVVERSGWGGEIQLWEADGEGHGFHLHRLRSEQGVKQVRRIAAFFNPTPLLSSR